MTAKKDERLAAWFGTVPNDEGGVSEYVFGVPERIVSEKTARAYFRKALGVDRLPDGTTVEDAHDATFLRCR